MTLLDPGLVTHDAMLRVLFADLARAQAILRALVPREVALDLDGLPEALATEFIDQWFSHTRADPAFRYQLKSDGHLYIPLEQKSA